jgi:hypothetical protein
MALGTLWMIDLVLAAASIVVLVVLLYLYRANFRTLRSPLSLGLIVFAALFLLENLAAMYFYFIWNDSLRDTGYASSVAMPMLLLNAVELVAFSTLLLVSWR